MNNYLQYHNPVECQKLHTSLENNWERFIAGHELSRVKTITDELKKRTQNLNYSAQLFSAVIVKKKNEHT